MLSPDATDPGLAAAVPRLLVVDDDELLRKMATYTLQQAGFDVVEASDGPHALALLFASDRADHLAVPGQLVELALQEIGQLGEGRRRSREHADRRDVHRRGVVLEV